MQPSGTPQCPQHKRPMTPSIDNTNVNNMNAPRLDGQNKPNQNITKWICPDCGTDYLTDYLQMIEEYADKTGKTLEQLTEDPFID